METEEMQRGNHGYWLSKLDPDQRANIIRLKHEKRWSNTALAKRYRVSTRTIIRILHEAQ